MSQLVLLGDYLTELRFFEILMAATTIIAEEILLFATKTRYQLQDQLRSCMVGTFP